MLSCRRCGIDPHAYIRDLIQRLPAMKNTDDFTGLLPHDWKPPAEPIVPVGHELDAQLVTSDN